MTTNQTSDPTANRTADQTIDRSAEPAPGTSPLDRLHEAESWVFDLDNTLYPASSRLFDQVDWRITDFVARYLDLDRTEARSVQKRYFREFGTTMQGLMACHGLDPADYLAYVHDIDLSPIAPDARLTAALEALPGRKVVFTNGSEDHARRIMAHLGIEAHFDDVWDIVASEYVPKPDPGTYARMVARHAIDPGRAVMVEDMAKNLKPAAAMGMTCVWVRTDTDYGRDGHHEDHVHHEVDDLAVWLDEVVRPLR